jgi:hypothetical protein
MKKTLLLVAMVLILIFPEARTQTVLFSEGFESGEIPLTWKEEFVKGAISWRYENGGYSLNPSIPNSRKPIAAHSGSYNALFQFQSSNNEATKLVTKKISALEFAVKPELHFYHAQFDWKHGADYYHDYLRVYYKNGSNSAWKLLTEYTSATTDWVERIIQLPDNDLSGDYYLAFEGETKWGWGTCIDDIQIVETGVKQKTLSSISVEQATDMNISSGTASNPILRINLKVSGNSGSFPLNSLAVTSLNTDDADIESGGVKLYMTQDVDFNTDHPIGSGVSFTGGVANFTGLNYSLPTGYSYIWVAYDVKSTAGHRNVVDAKLAASSININGQQYMAAEQSPAGSREILRTLYSDDFESGLGWTLSGEFEYDRPQGLGGSQGNPDPASAYSGTYVIGTDLNGQGEYPGDYEKNLLEDEYYAISDTFDFTYFNDLSIRYMRYLNIGINDDATIDVSADGGKTWKNAWSNTSMILDDGWKLHEIDITSQAARQKKVLVRYGIGQTNDYWQLSGWNIDNFSVTGNYVSKDVGISRVVAPVMGCGHTDSESVTVMVKNHGAADSYGVIPLQYSFDGNKTITYDTLKQVIAFGDSVQFTFKKKANLSVAGIYDFRVTTHMTGDDDVSNDGITRSFYAQPTYAADHAENFESNGGLWMKLRATDTWETGIPGFGITPPSGSRVWMTRLLDHYPNGDSAFVESACYSNADGMRKILQLKYWMLTQTPNDGATMQFSTDNGTTWQPLDTTMGLWSWYTGMVQALKTRGWTGNSNGFTTPRILLPSGVTAASSMKFRMAFASDADSSNIGFAFDDFSISVAPFDIGISAVDSFADRCQYLNPGTVTVQVKNLGVNPVKKNETIRVGYDLNHTHKQTSTFTLASDLLPGKTVKYTFSVPVDVRTPGSYNLTAYTLSETDPYYWGSNNDTLSLDFQVFPNPLTQLTDTIATRMPDTVVIKPFYNPDYDYLWNDLSTGATLHVGKGGQYTVQVTDARGNGCISHDTTFVKLLFNDTGVDSLFSPYDHCGLSKTEYLQVRIRNFGNDRIPGGEKIVVGYRLNGGPAVTDTLLLSTALLPGHTVSHTLSRGAVDLSAKGTYDFRVFSTFGGDTIAGNDTLFKSISIWGHPVVNLGPDLTVKALTHTLDAGSGFATYQWDDASAASVRTINASGTYWVRVTDEHQCDDVDSVQIRLKIRDVSPGGFVSPVSSCQFTTGDQVALNVMNAGTDTVPSGQLITVTYCLDAAPPVTESFNLTAPLLPGQFKVHTFAGLVDLADTADYHFTAAVSMEDDIRTSNDTIVSTVYRYPKPEVNFGLDNIIYVPGISQPLEAGVFAHATYAWQDGYDQHLYNVTRSGNYHVTVTDTRTACYGGDTVSVFLIYTDIGVTSVSLPDSGCTGSYPHLTVGISNLGTSNIGKDAPIYVACEVNGVKILTDTLVRSGNFATGATLNLVLSAPVTIPEEGLNAVTFYTLYAGDMKNWTDSLKVSFKTMASPQVDFGDQNGVLHTDLPHLLDAGAGQQAYLWQDGSSGPTFTVLTAGTYSVTVTGENGCKTVARVSVNPVTGLPNDEQAANIVLYPNPGDGLFRIRTEGRVPDIATVEVYNNLGQLVFSDRAAGWQAGMLEIDIRHLPKGLYHLMVLGDGLTYRNTLIIE